jgi:hypothetical protein
MFIDFLMAAIFFPIWNASGIIRKIKGIFKRTEVKSRTAAILPYEFKGLLS